MAKLNKSNNIPTIERMLNFLFIVKIVICALVFLLAFRTVYNFFLASAVSIVPILTEDKSYTKILAVLLSTGTLGGLTYGSWIFFEANFIKFEAGIWGGAGKRIAVIIISCALVYSEMNLTKNGLTNDLVSAISHYTESKEYITYEVATKEIDATSAQLKEGLAMHQDRLKELQGLINTITSKANKAKRKLNWLENGQLQAYFEQQKLIQEDIKNVNRQLSDLVTEREKVLEKTRKLNQPLVEQYNQKKASAENIGYAFGIGLSVVLFSVTALSFLISGRILIDNQQTEKITLTANKKDKELEVKESGASKLVEHVDGSPVLVEQPTNQQPTNQPTSNQPTSNQTSTNQQPVSNQPATNQQPSFNQPVTSSKSMKEKAADLIGAMTGKPDPKTNAIEYYVIPALKKWQVENKPCSLSDLAKKLEVEVNDFYNVKLSWERIRGIYRERVAKDEEFDAKLEQAAKEQTEEAKQVITT